MHIISRTIYTIKILEGIPTLIMTGTSRYERQFFKTSSETIHDKPMRQDNTVQREATTMIESSTMNTTNQLSAMLFTTSSALHILYIIPIDFSKKDIPLESILHASCDGQKCRGEWVD